MYHLVESIRIENRQLHHIDLHNSRFNRSRKQLFGLNDWIELQTEINIPANISDSRYKCRITTNDGIRLYVEITPYVQRETVSLKIVKMDTIDYSIKTDHRELLDKAYNLREECDDVIIIKNNLLTDSWAANILLFDGKKWVTPDSCLLKGVQREYLLSQSRIEERRITLDDLMNYNKVKLINALVDFERATEIPIQNIKQ